MIGEFDNSFGIMKSEEQSILLRNLCLTCYVLLVGFADFPLLGDIKLFKGNLFPKFLTEPSVGFDSVKSAEVLESLSENF